MEGNEKLAAAAKSFAEDNDMDTPTPMTNVHINDGDEDAPANTETEINKNEPTEIDTEVKNTEVKTPEAKKEDAPADDSAVKKSWKEHFQETDEYKERKRKEDEVVYTSKMKEIEEFENSEIGKLWAKSKAENKSLIEVVKELNFNDVTKLSDQEKFIKSIESLYANDENKEELLAEQWEAFNQKPDFEKRKELAAITNELLKTQQEKISQYTPKQQEQAQIDPKEAEMLTRAGQELDSYLDSIVKTEVNGIKMSPVRVERIYNAVQSLPTELFRTEQGTLDIKKAVAIANYALFGDVMLATAKKEAKTEGRVEALARKHNQSAGMAHNMPIGGERSDSLKAAASAFLNDK